MCLTEKCLVTSTSLTADPVSLTLCKQDHERTATETAYHRSASHAMPQLAATAYPNEQRRKEAVADRGDERGSEKRPMNRS